MDAKILKKDGFRPITLQLTLDYEDDLLNLLIRLNMSAKMINDRLDNVESQLDNRYLDARADTSASQLWRMLDELAAEYGLTNDNCT